jgi:predicted DNA-binding transcriptional regulator YafY
MLSEEEIEALVLGSRWVARHTDPELAAAARNALAKIHAVLPPALRHELESNALMVPGATAPGPDALLASIRLAIRRERKLRLAYKDEAGQASERVVWPFALGFFEQTRMVAAWCERRLDYRHFRVDRIGALQLLEDRYPRHRQEMLKEWRRVTNIPAPAD